MESDITLFHNERVDGGRRTGLSVNGRRMLEEFQPGDAEHDPALDWYIDVICYSQNLPATPADAAVWLTTYSNVLRESVENAAERLSGGIDLNEAPWSHEYTGPENRPMRISISAIHYLSSHEIAARIRNFLKRDWDGFLNRASAMHSVPQHG